MALTLQQIRELDPDLAALNDNDLATYLHEEYAPESSFQDFSKVVGYEDPATKPGMLRDYVGLPLLKGTSSVGSAIGYGLEKVGFDEAGQALQESDVRLQKTLTERQSMGARADAEKTFIGKDGGYGGYNLGTLSQEVFGSLPGTVAMAAPGAGAAGIVTKASEMLGLGAAFASRLGAVSGLTAKSADTAIGSAVGFGASEGAFSGATNAAQVQTEIRSADLDKLANHPAFQAAYWYETDESLPPEERAKAARELIAEKAGNEVFLDTFVKTGGISALTGGGVFGMMRGAKDKVVDEATDGLLKRMGKGFMVEGVAQEAPQSVLEQRTTNQAKFDYLDQAQDLNEGVLNAGLSGAAAGGVIGMGGGVFSDGRKAPPKPDPLADSIKGIAQASSVDEAIGAMDAALSWEQPNFAIHPDADAIVRNRTNPGQGLLASIDARYQDGGYNPLAGSWQTPTATHLTPTGTSNETDQQATQSPAENIQPVSPGLDSSLPEQGHLADNVGAEKSTSELPYHVSNIDELIGNGGGLAKILHTSNGTNSNIKFKDFAVGIDDDSKTAEVLKVELDPSERGKNHGLNSYVALGNALAEKGITLTSSSSQYKDGKNLWHKLAKMGLAEKQATGYAFKAKKEAVERSDGTTNTVEDTGMTMLHGSGNSNLKIDDIEIIRTSGQKQGKKGRTYGGFYGSNESDIEHSKNYASMMGGDSTIYSVSIKPGTKVLNKIGDITRLSDKYIKELTDQGYGVVTGKDPRGRTEHVVIDKNAISQITPIKPTTNEAHVSPLSVDSQPGAEMANGFRLGHKPGTRYRVTEKVGTTGGVLLDKRNDNVNSQSSFYVGIDGNLVDSDNIVLNNSQTLDLLWRPESDELRQKAAEILNKLATIDPFDKTGERDKLKAELKKLVKENNVSPQAPKGTVAIQPATRGANQDSSGTVATGATEAQALPEQGDSAVVEPAKGSVSNATLVGQNEITQPTGQPLEQAPPKTEKENPIEAAGTQATVSPIAANDRVITKGGKQGTVKAITGNRATVEFDGIDKPGSVAVASLMKVTEPVKGIVGGKISKGESQLTASGRTTTPHPGLVRGKTNLADKWLIENAALEAEARGDEFNARQFRADVDSKVIPQASKDAAEEYLFGQQPDVQRPFLKPLNETTASPKNDPQTPKTETVSPNSGTDSATASMVGADSQSGQGVSTPKARKKAVIQDNDDLLAAIAKLGGLNRDEAEAQGIDPAAFGTRGYGIMRVFTKAGRSYDGMAEVLREYGFDVPLANDLVKLVSSAVNQGVKIHTPTGSEYHAEIMAREQFDDETAYHSQRIEALYEAAEQHDKDFGTNWLETIQKIDDLSADDLTEWEKDLHDDREHRHQESNRSGETPVSGKEEATGTETPLIGQPAGNGDLLTPINAVGSNQPKAQTKAPRDTDLFVENEAEQDTLDIKQGIADKTRAKDAKRNGNAPDGGELFDGLGQGDVSDLAKKPDQDRFANNTLFTADKVAAARERMKKKLGTLNSGFDPELMIDGMTLAGAYVESGVRAYGDYVKAMVADFGDGIRPYVRSFYEGVRSYPGLNTQGMTPFAELEAADRFGIRHGESWRFRDEAAREVAGVDEHNIRFKTADKNGKYSTSTPNFLQAKREWSRVDEVKEPSPDANTQNSKPTPKPTEAAHDKPGTTENIDGITGKTTDKPGVSTEQPRPPQQAGDQGSESELPGGSTSIASTDSGQGQGNELSGDEGLGGHATNDGSQRPVGRGAGDNSRVSSAIGANNYDLRDKPPIALTPAKRRDVNNLAEQILQKPIADITESDKDILRQYTGNGGLSAQDSVDKGAGVFNQHYTDYTTVREIERDLSQAAATTSQIEKAISNLAKRLRSAEKNKTDYATANAGIDKRPVPAYEDQTDSERKKSIAAFKKRMADQREKNAIRIADLETDIAQLQRDKTQREAELAEHKANIAYIRDRFVVNGVVSLDAIERSGEVKPSNSNAKNDSIQSPNGIKAGDEVLSPGLFGVKVLRVIAPSNSSERLRDWKYEVEDDEGGDNYLVDASEYLPIPKEKMSVDALHDYYNQQKAQAREGKFSKAQLASGSTVTEIESLLPPRVKHLVEAGKLKVVQSIDSVPDSADSVDVDGVEGFYNPIKDELFLVADNLTADNLNSVLSHELFHRLIATDPSMRAAIAAFTDYFKRRFALAAAGKGSALERAAYQRVIDAETPVASQREEFQAYLISEYSRNPDRLSAHLKRVIQDFLARIRMALLRIGIPPKNLTPADLLALAQYGARLNTEASGNNTLRSTKDWRTHYEQLLKDGDIEEIDYGRVPGFPGQNRGRNGRADSERTTTDTEATGNDRDDAERDFRRLTGWDPQHAFTIDGEIRQLVHRAHSPFESFDDAKRGSNTGRPFAKLGHFLSTEDIGRSEYGQHVLHTYLRAKPREVKRLSLDEMEALGDKSADYIERYRQHLINQGYKVVAIPQADTYIALQAADTHIVPRVKYSKAVKPAGNADLDEFKRRAGLGPKKTLSATIGEILSRGIDGNWQLFKAHWEAIKPGLEQGIFDKFLGIKLAEQEILGEVAHSLSGYIGARFSTGSSSTMAAVLQFGAPEWRDGVIQKKDGSKGFADILQPVKDDLENFTAWMVARRASRLLKEGKENNFTEDQINAGLALMQPHYQTVADDIAALNASILDLAQTAGLIDAESRKLWESADYIPFYRLIEGQKSTGPRNHKGLSHQSSGIKMLKGGENPMSDPLGNMMQNWAHLIDAAMKNAALDKTLTNLEDSRFVTKVPRVQFHQALVPKEQIKKLMLESGLPEDIVDAMPADLTEGIAKLWAVQAPTDPDIVRVMRGGKTEYYRVNDTLLLNSLAAVNQSPLPGLFKPMRYMKTLLTSAVTADPTFMARNFIRDSMHSWTIAEEKGFKFGVDSIHGAVKSFNEEGGYIDMMFAGASFQGGYGNYNNPDAARTSMDAALRKRGIKDVRGFTDSIIDTPKKYWELYRSISDAIENANREAILENSKSAGDEKAKYLFEAKDIMDFSMQGSFTLVRAMSDMLPFFNARLVGLYRLAKAGKTDEARAMILRKGASIALFSLALMALNADNDDYEELEDWDKDQYFHFFVGNQHFRIPKPFELGLIFGTIPERSARALLGKDTLGEFAARMGHGASDTLAFNPVPQLFRPFLELYANKDMFTGRSIEGMSDEGKLPSARYNAYTSETMRALSEALPEALGASPKRLEHLVQGFTGAMGMYVLGASDVLVRNMQGAPDSPALRLDRVPVLKAFYQESPALHTKYGTQFYDMLREVEQIQRTINAYDKEGRHAEADALRSENAQKLALRKPMNKASKALSKLRHEVDAVYRSDLSASEKRQRIDALMAKSNQYARNMVQKSHPHFH